MEDSDMTELHVGAGFALRTLAQAAAVAKSGDTVIVHSPSLIYL